MVFIVALFCMLALVQILNGGLRSLRRKKTRSRVVGNDDEDPDDEDPGDEDPDEELEETEAV